MSADPATPDPDEQMLARLAAMDMAAAEAAHARFMAAAEPDESARAGRTYQKMARSLRQTLMLKARLAREARQAAREAVEVQRAQDREETALRKDRLKAGVEAALRREIDDFSDDEHWDFQERLDAAITTEALADGFLSEDLGRQVARLVGQLGFRPAPDGDGEAGVVNGAGPEPAFHDSA